MTLEISTSIAQKIHDQMATGRYSSEDDLLAAALLALEENDVELRAVEDGLASLDRREEGTVLEQAFDRLREKHRISGMP
jgi:Arc/MetJ-type ribon-helix-helix transcriptional regulator